MIDGLAALGGGRCVMECAAGADHMPNLARDAMHVDGKAYPAITNERQPKFFFTHADGVTPPKGVRKHRCVLFTA